MFTSSTESNIKKMETKNSLKLKRTLKGLSIKEIAEQTGVSKGTLSAMEQQKFIPNVSAAVKIARFFGLKVEDIFHVSD